MALDGLLSEQTFIVDNYKEVKIKVSQSKAGFTRSRAALSLYAAIQKVTGGDFFPASRFTTFKGKERMGGIDFMGTACSSGSYRADSANVSLPVVISSNNSSMVVTGNKAGTSRSAVATLVNVINNKNSDMKLDCRWYGQRLGARIALLAPSSTLAYSHIVKEDPMSFPALRDVVVDQTLGVSTVIRYKIHSLHVS